MQGPLKLSYFFLIFHVIVTIRIYIFCINYIYIYFVYTPVDMRDFAFYQLFSYIVNRILLLSNQNHFALKYFIYY